jgi:hypothetical protein
MDLLNFMHQRNWKMSVIVLRQKQVFLSISNLALIGLD